MLDSRNLRLSATIANISQEQVLAMTQTPSSTDRRGRIFPNVNWSEEETLRRAAEMKQLRDRCYPIFEEVRPTLMHQHYNWFIAIEPESGEYFIEPDDLTCSKKLLQKYPNATFYMFRLNETGSCYKI